MALWKQVLLRCFWNSWEMKGDSDVAVLEVQCCPLLVPAPVVAPHSSQD